MAAAVATVVAAATVEVVPPMAATEATAMAVALTMAPIIMAAAVLPRQSKSSK